MSIEVTEVERESKHALVIQKKVATFRLGNIMGPAYTRIYNYLQSEDVVCESEDVPFAQYHNVDWERLNKKGIFGFFDVMFLYKWEVDIGIPCPKGTSNPVGIEPIEIASGSYLRALHIGPYMKVGDTYNVIRAYAQEHNLELDNRSIEFYQNDPRETAEKELETEVLVALK